MPLEHEVNRTYLGRGAAAVVFYIPDPDMPEEVQSARLTYQSKFSDGQIVERDRDFLARLQDDEEGRDIHLPALQALKVYVLDRIDNEVPPL